MEDGVRNIKINKLIERIINNGYHIKPYLMISALPYHPNRKVSTQTELNDGKLMNLFQELSKEKTLSHLLRILREEPGSSQEVDNFLVPREAAQKLKGIMDNPKKGY